MSYDTLYLESKTVKATRPQRKTTRGRKKNLTAATIQKKKLPKARVAVKQ